MGCNAGRNPIQEAFYDGVNVDPLEVLFVKVKASMRDARWPHVLQVPPPPLPPTCRHPTTACDALNSEGPEHAT